VLIDLAPLRRSRDLRLLVLGELVSVFGTQLTTVAVPYQVYQLTRSSLDVGLVSLAQLFPLIGGALLGGSVVDAMDRRRLLMVASGGLACIAGALVLARLLPGFRHQRGFRTPPTMLKAELEHSWRWRESNPRPSVHHQGFSGRSLLRFSQPRRSCKQDADRLSRCSMSRLVPRPGQAVIPLADARHRVEGIPGLTHL
jgi:hypothetical protein